MYNGIELLAEIKTGGAPTFITCDFSRDPNRILDVSKNHRIILISDLVPACEEKSKLTQAINVDIPRTLEDVHGEVRRNIKDFLSHFNSRDSRVKYALISTQHDGYITPAGYYLGPGFELKCRLFRASRILD